MDAEALEPGHLIAGRYRVVRQLGIGGMGTVYEAQHLELGRVVAVKVLHPQMGRSGDMAARFMREARSAAQIGHPGIVQVFDLGTDGNTPFLVMEKLEGEELAARIERAHPLPVASVVQIGIDLCDALAAAHEHGIIHRDLKPPNVFLARQGRHQDVVKVLDFGIAKLMQGADDIKTRTGQVFGTPMYMAPEQLRDSKDVDQRTDVYAIGCVLFQALAGRPPFDASTYPDLVFRICAAPRPKLWEIRADVPRALSEIVERAMAVQAQDRFASAAELGAALAALPAGSLSISGSGSTQAFAGSPVAVAGVSARPISAEALSPHSQTKPPQERKGSSTLWTVVVAVALVGAGVAGLALQNRGGETSPLSSGATAEPTAHLATAPLPSQALLEPVALPSASASAVPTTSASTAPASSKPAAVSHRPTTGKLQPTPPPATPAPPSLVPR